MTKYPKAVRHHVARSNTHVIRTRFEQGGVCGVCGKVLKKRDYFRLTTNVSKKHKSSVGFCKIIQVEHGAIKPRVRPGPRIPNNALIP
jgi:hypothetical protein